MPTGKWMRRPLLPTDVPCSARRAALGWAVEARFARGVDYWDWMSDLRLRVVFLFYAPASTHSCLADRPKFRPVGPENGHDLFDSD